jgi:hypothetical protein
MMRSIQQNHGKFFFTIYQAIWNVELYCFMFPYNIHCRITSFEEGAVLCNFLPLIREYLPSTAEEIEADIISLAQSEGIEACCLEMLSTVTEGFLALSLLTVILAPK